jgi:hypothetical protein
MYCKKIVLLDGTPAGHENMAPLLAMLHGILKETGCVVTSFTLRGTSMAHCKGCFGCWVETPGICSAADSGRDIVKSIIHSDMTIFFTPVTFGGYSSTLKKLVDRRIPLTMPYFCKVHGEIHHTARYEHYPRLVGIGIQSRHDAEEAAVFQLVVGRNAINFHAPSFAADVIVDTDQPELQRDRLRSLLTREDPMPFGKEATLALPSPDADQKARKECGAEAKRALLIVGSPKVKSASTSGALGSYLLERLIELGWKTETLTLGPPLLKEYGEAELLAAVDRAELLILSFPLYIDALPFLVTRALETIASQRRDHPELPAKKILALCNNGFPEAFQNGPALAICRQFARQCAFTWAGGLALGAGEALSSGEPLSARGGNGHPPTRHVMLALDLAAKALDEGRAVPDAAQKLLDKCPIPFIPFPVWSWLFAKLGGRHWRQRATQHGVGRRDLFNRPYERV